LSEGLLSGAFIAEFFLQLAWLGMADFTGCAGLQDSSGDGKLGNGGL